LAEIKLNALTGLRDKPENTIANTNTDDKIILEIFAEIFFDI
jgi:hypothetical protein